jgi:hypothetical protein
MIKWTPHVDGELSDICTLLVGSVVSKPARTISGKPAAIHHPAVSSALLGAQIAKIKMIAE